MKPEGADPPRVRLRSGRNRRPSGDRPGKKEQALWWSKRRLIEVEKEKQTYAQEICDTKNHPKLEHLERPLNLLLPPLSAFLPSLSLPGYRPTTRPLGPSPDAPSQTRKRAQAPGTRRGEVRNPKQVSSEPAPTGRSFSTSRPAHRTARPRRVRGASAAHPQPPRGRGQLNIGHDSVSLHGRWRKHSFHWVSVSGIIPNKETRASGHTSSLSSQAQQCLPCPPTRPTPISAAEICGIRLSEST